MTLEEYRKFQDEHGFTCGPSKGKLYHTIYNKIELGKPVTINDIATIINEKTINLCEHLLFLSENLEGFNLKTECEEIIHQRLSWFEGAIAKEFQNDNEGINEEWIAKMDV